MARGAAPNAVTGRTARCEERPPDDASNDSRDGSVGGADKAAPQAAGGGASHPPVRAQSS